MYYNIFPTDKHMIAYYNIFPTDKHMIAVLFHNVVFIHCHRMCNAVVDLVNEIIFHWYISYYRYHADLVDYCINSTVDYVELLENNDFRLMVNVQHFQEIRP